MRKKQPADANHPRLLLSCAPALATLAEKFRPTWLYTEKLSTSYIIHQGVPSLTRSSGKQEQETHQLPNCNSPGLVNEVGVPLSAESPPGIYNPRIDFLKK